MATLEIRDLWKAYNGQPALQGLNLDVRRGELLGLLGPNGAGKTTTIKIVAGLLRTDRGVVVVNGKDIAEDPVAYKAGVGYMPENPALPDYLSPEEFLNYVARVRDLEPERRRAKVRDFLHTLDLIEKRRELIVTLSRGMKQKLALACALLHEPSLIMLDEPLAGIDPAGQHRIKELLRDLASGGASVLVSTHMLDTTERLCDRVTIIHRGRNVASGTLGELREETQAGMRATLEEVFLRLTSEARAPLTEETTAKRRFGLWRRGR